MKSENYKFPIVKANKIDIDVRRQMAEIFAGRLHTVACLFFQR